MSPTGVKAEKVGTMARLGCLRDFRVKLDLAEIVMDSRDVDTIANEIYVDSVDCNDIHPLMLLVGYTERSLTASTLLPVSIPYRMSNSTSPGPRTDTTKSEHANSRVQPQ